MVLPSPRLPSLPLPWRRLPPRQPAWLPFRPDNCQWVFAARRRHHSSILCASSRAAGRWMSLGRGQVANSLGPPKKEEAIVAIAVVPVVETAKPDICLEPKDIPLLTQETVRQVSRRAYGDSF